MTGILVLVLWAHAQKLTDPQLVLKARTCEVVAKVEWNRHNANFREAQELSLVWRAVDSSGIYAHCKAARAEKADLILTLDDDLIFDRITLQVHNPDDNSVVYEESRDRIAVENDVRRLILHYLNAEDEARRAEDTQQEFWATLEQEKRTEQELANQLPRYWQSTCLPNVENCKPQSYEVWISGDTLYEKSDNTLPSVVVATSCTTRRNGRQWLGSCTYSWTWTTPPKTTCKVETSEQVTDVTLSRVAGVSQAIDYSPLKATPPSCPVAGTEYHDFAYTPKASNGHATDEKKQ